LLSRHAAVKVAANRVAVSAWSFAASFTISSRRRAVARAQSVERDDELLHAATNKSGAMTSFNWILW
jgi:hypothetical protein